MIIFLYLLSLIGLVIYSYALVDPNLTLINHPVWAWFRDKMVFFGYYQRLWSSVTFLILILILTIIYLYLINNYKQFCVMKLVLLTGGILIFAYPFLSHDFFNYMFDAKILTFYHQNPYLHKALDFPSDPWLRFMHWTHRSYPYGPIFLPITVVPSILSFGKFFLNFFLFKTTWLLFYLFTVYILDQIDKKRAVLFAFHPLLIIEGLVNNHNDLIIVSLAIIGWTLLMSKKQLVARLFLLLSGGIKYITLPLIFLSKKNDRINQILFIILGCILIYLSLTREIQPWYFLSFLIFIPIFPELVMRMTIFFTGLIVSYYPYIAYGEWDIDKLIIKKVIILVFTAINLLVLVFSKKTFSNLFF